MTGYLDEVLPDYDPEQHTIVASGRSKAGDLIDCSGREQRLDGRTLQQIAETLARPYGIEVVDNRGCGQAIPGIRAGGRPAYPPKPSSARRRYVARGWSVTPRADY